MFSESIYQGWFVLYIVKGVGHEDAVEIAQREGDIDEVGFDRNEGHAVDGFALKSGAEVETIERAAGRQEARKRFGEEAGATAEVGPAEGGRGAAGRGAGGHECGGADGGAEGWTVEEVDGF